MIDLAMETEELKLPLDDWLVKTERGIRVNKAMLAEQVASDEGGNLISVCQTFWKYSCGVWKREYYAWNHSNYTRKSKTPNCFSSYPRR